MADLGPEASNAFKLPIFEISILKDEKKLQALVQILSPGGDRGVLPTVYPQLKNRQMTSSTNLPIKWPI
jgi:hypothetical protein